MQAHNLKVVGSNPAPATNLKPSKFPMISGFFCARVSSAIPTQISSKLALRYFVLGIITPKYPLDRFLPDAHLIKVGRTFRNG